MTRPDFSAPGWRGATILAVYLYQGLVAGFAMTALPNWHAAQGAPLSAIGAFLALTGIPWMVQPLWGPVVDRFGGLRAGARRGWVLAGMAGAIACLSALPFAGGTLAGAGLALLAHNACAALVDTAMDGWIMDRTPLRRLGRATALTRMGFACGMAAGAAGFGWAIPALGMEAAAVLLPILAVLAALLPAWVREGAGAHMRPVPGFAALLRGLGRDLLRRRALSLAGLCVAVEFATAAFGLRLSVGLVQEAGWDAASLSRLQGALALLGGTLGALLVALWVDRAGPLRAVVTLLAVTALCHALAAAILVHAPPDAGWQAAALAMSGLSPALFFVALAPAVMLESRGAAGATRFALFMAALNGGGVAGAAAAGGMGGLEAWQVGLLASLVLAGCALAFAKRG